MPAFLTRKTVVVVLAALVVAGSAGVAGGLVWAKRQIEAPGPLAERTVHVVAGGAGLGAIARRLEGEGIIADARLFRLYARYRKVDAGLHAGEYDFEPGLSMAAVLDKLVAGRTLQRFVTIPEGLTSREAIALVTEADSMTGEAEIPVEGSLLPETYTYSRDEDRAAVVARMQEAMQKALAELWAGRADDLPVKTPEEALILASIVEKETGLAEERPRVAAVFINRLRRGMKLQSDPTVVYALTKGERELGRALRFKDLEVRDPYNTYYAKGLPPGPICNPGRAALAAVLNPIESKELYFVADGTGGHAFAETLEQHNRNVAKWRKVQREQRRQARQRQQEQQQQ